MRWQTRVLIGTALFLSATGPVWAQAPAALTVAQEFESLHFRSIGPATMSGRVADLAVYEANPAVYYVGTAHGGVWKTTSNGALFEPLFQNEGLISIGDVEISQRNPDLVWVGTGESNNRQSTSWGGGIYKSTDGGKTFQHMGLANSRHINRIVIDPSNDDIVLVAATGPLFGSGGDRGIYKTTNGGRTWTQVLKVDDDTGANDLVISATNPRTMFASTYQRRRTTCCFVGGGPGSGIWTSTNGGDSWTRVTGGGLPEGPLGRIAIDIYRKDGRILYASIEGPGPVGGGRGGGGGAGGGGGGGRAGGAAGGGGAVSGDAQAAQQQQQQPGPTGVYRSGDGGQTWERVASVNPRPMYFSQMRIDPSSPDRIYMGGVGLQMSIDGGKTFATDAALVTHDDVHAIWINPANPDHILIGNDGGLAVSYDMSRTWVFLPNLPVGLFYHVSYDMETPYNICGGMQDNYNWCGPSRSRHSRGIMNYDWFQVQGGDGFVAMPDPRDSRIIYTESQDGNIIRRNKVTGEAKNIRPCMTGVGNCPAGNVVNASSEPAFRWHWDTPMILSPHDPGRLIVAANRVFVSTDRGDSWTALSGDLTTNANRNDIVTMGVRNSEIRNSRNDGISQWPAIVTLAESPRQAGVFYTGTDDGVVSMTRDNGANWENVTSRLTGFPKGAFVSEVVPSRFDAGTVYITVDNHRENDYNTYMWVSTDFGRTFRSLNGNLQGENVRTLTEDTRNPDVLYIGTETGVFLTLDRGRTWRRLKANLPTVRVDEITIHPRDNALLVATHGRALFVLDNLEPIQEYTAAARVTADAALFTPPLALQWKTKDDRNEEFWGHQFFTGENPPNDAVIQYYVKKQPNDLKLVITDGAGRAVRQLTAQPNRRAVGVQTMCWDMRVEPIVMPPAVAQTAAPAGGRGGGGGGAGGRGGGAAQANIPGVPTPLPPVGYMATNICGGGGGGGFGGGGGGGFGGGGATAGPHVVPGTYNVALVVDGRTVGTKPLRLIMDPAVILAGTERQRYNDLVAELHALQQTGTNTANQLTGISRQLATASTVLDSARAVPENAKQSFTVLKTDFEAVRVKFGVPAPGAQQQQQAGGGGRGGGGGGGAAAQAAALANALGRVATAKAQIMGIWETPSEAMVRQANEAKAALTAAIAEANAFLARANTVHETLRRYNITIIPPN